MNFRDKITVSFVKKINMNPEKKDKILKKLKLYSKLGQLVPYTLKHGYERNIYNANGVSLEIYKKKESPPKKLVVVIHGGVFILGLINTYRDMHKAICKVSDDIAVCLIDYRIAPNYKYPAAHDDVRTCWEFLQDELGYKPCDMILLGDSSGGNLTLSLLLRLRDDNKPLPAAAIVISPWTDLLATGESYKSNYNRDIVFGRVHSVPDESKIKKLLACDVFSYAGTADRNDPYLSPILGDYHDMPPILMTVGSHEMLLDDTLRVAEKIKAADGNVEVIIGEEMFHIYPLLYKISPTAKDTFDKILSFIKDHIS